MAVKTLSLDNDYGDLGNTTFPDCTTVATVKMTSGVCSTVRMPPQFGILQVWLPTITSGTLSVKCRPVQTTATLQNLSHDIYGTAFPKGTCTGAAIYTFAPMPGSDVVVSTTATTTTMTRFQARRG